VALTPNAVSVIPDAASLSAGGKQRFLAVVASAEPKENVTWILTPPLGELTSDDTTGEGIYTAPTPVPDNCTVQVIAADRYGRRASAAITLATKPWRGLGVYLLGAYLFCVFSLVVFLVGLVPARVPNVQEVRTEAAQADSALQKLLTQKANAGATPSADLIAQVNAATKDAAAKKTALDDATGLDVDTILIHNKLNREVDLMLLVLLSGALGSFLHLAQSFSDFVGNRTLKSSWAWWYALRPFVGAALALVIYASIRGGLISVGAAGFDASGLNPYGLMAGAALAGLFSKDATQKLGEVFKNLFSTAKAEQSKDKLNPQAQPAAPAVKPAADAGATAPTVR
jgi:hypothetical protein